MPWLPMYLTSDDVPLLVDLLSKDAEIAFLISDGPKRWRAVKEASGSLAGCFALWHIPSGPLPLLGATENNSTELVENPWAGWREKLSGADPKTPFFGAGHPGVIWWNLHPAGSDANSVCGLSSFEWIGNRYQVLGFGAKPETERWWKSLRRRVQRLARKVPRQSLSSPRPLEVFAFPAALSKLQAGCLADQNPR